MSQMSPAFLAEQANQEAPVRPDAKQVKLSRLLLVPHLAALEADLWRLRAEYDEQFAASDHPRKAEYPVGFCLEISKGVYALLQREIAAPRSAGMMALREFCRQGGLAKRIWGNLRDRYFQNAFQIGNLYVDVANDTVDPAKPKVEILPLAKSGFNMLDDFGTYARIAEKYWKGTAYPNRYLPDLAPMFPVLLVRPQGRIELHAQYQTILYRNMYHDFADAERFLLNDEIRHRALPDEMIRVLSDKAGLICEPFEDDQIKNLFRAARTSQLRLDSQRCQVMLDRVIAISRTA
ncbi:MAG: hypothetical protein ABID63_01585 [Pseudomonadota bacterium]